MSGHRLTIWIPEEDTWILQALREIRREADEKGIPLSQGAAAVEILKIGLADRAPRLEQDS